MANTKISELISKSDPIICEDNRMEIMYGWFKDYGTALNYCIKHHIDVKKIIDVYTPPEFELPDFYSIEGVEGKKVLIIDPLISPIKF